MHRRIWKTLSTVLCAPNTSLKTNRNNRPLVGHCVTESLSVALWSWWHLLLQGLTTKPRQKWGSQANGPPEPSETQRQNGKHTHSRFTKYLIKKESNEYYIKNQLNFSLPSSSNSPKHQSGLGILSLVPPVWPVGQQRFPCPFLSVWGMFGESPSSVLVVHLVAWGSTRQTKRQRILNNRMWQYVWQVHNWHHGIFYWVKIYPQSFHRAHDI